MSDQAESNGPRVWTIELTERDDPTLQRDWSVRGSVIVLGEKIEVIEMSAFVAMKARAELAEAEVHKLKSDLHCADIAAVHLVRKSCEALENRIEALRAGLEHLAEPHKIHDKEWTCTIDAHAILAADDAAKGGT